MEIVGILGVPVSFSTHASNHPGVTLVRLNPDFYMTEAMPYSIGILCRKIFRILPIRGYRYPTLEILK